jgi:hypothetical protein
MAYEKGDALKGTTVDLNDINFKNKDVMKWTNPKSSKKTRSVSSSLIGMKGFGQSPKISRL